MNEEISEILKDASIWVDDRKMKRLRKAVGQWRGEHPGQEMSREKMLALISSVPLKKEEVVARVVQVLRDNQLVPEASLVKAKNYITTDAQLTSLLKEWGASTSFAWCSRSSPPARYCCRTDGIHRRPCGP
jgi:hypothetical protein